MARVAAELKALVRERLAACEVPREIEFVEELPLTTSGKIRRGELREHAHRVSHTSILDQQLA